MCSVASLQAVDYRTFWGRGSLTTPITQQDWADHCNAVGFSKQSCHNRVDPASVSDVACEPTALTRLDRDEGGVEVGVGVGGGVGARLVAGVGARVGVGVGIELGVGFRVGVGGWGNRRGVETFQAYPCALLYLLGFKRDKSFVTPQCDLLTIMLLYCMY